MATRAEHPQTPLRRRSRAAHPPDRRVYPIFPYGLFTPQDVQKFADEASVTDPRLKLRITSDLDLIRAAQQLHMAFDWAIRCDQYDQWNREPERRRRWFQSISTHANALIEALDLTPAECRDTTRLLGPGFRIPSIVDFRTLTDGMAEVRPPLPGEIDRLTRLAWRESDVHNDADDFDATGKKCPYRGRASFLIDRLPRTLALLAALAEYRHEQVDREPHRRGEKPDQLRRQLFRSLAGAHHAIFACKPRTRDKIGEPRLGSISWARVVIEDASRKIEAKRVADEAEPTEEAELAEAALLTKAARLAEAAKYVAELRVIAR
jgi:hypothetical protein